MKSERCCRGEWQLDAHDRVAGLPTRRLAGASSRVRLGGGALTKDFARSSLVLQAQHTAYQLTDVSHAMHVGPVGRTGQHVRVGQLNKGSDYQIVMELSRNTGIFVNAEVVLELYQTLHLSQYSSTCIEGFEWLVSSRLDR